MAYYFAAGDYENVNKLLRKVLQFNISLGLPCVVGIMALSEDIIRVVAGDAFIAAGPVLQILMFGFIFSLVGGSFLGNAILLPSKQEKYYMIVCCCTGIINIILNYIAIPYWGARAAAGTTAICSALIMILLLFKVDKKVRITSIPKIIIPPIVGCVMILLVCMTFRFVENVFIRTFTCIGISGVLYLVVQIILKNELVLELLDTVKKKLKKA